MTLPRRRLEGLFAGIDVYIDSTLPPGVLQLRDRDTDDVQVEMIETTQGWQLVDQGEEA